MPTLRRYPTHDPQLNVALQVLKSSSFRLYMLLREWFSCKTNNYAYYTSRSLARICHTNRSTINRNLASLRRAKLIRTLYYDATQKVTFFKLVPLRETYADLLDAPHPATTSHTPDEAAALAPKKQTCTKTVQYHVPKRYPNSLSERERERTPPTRGGGPLGRSAPKKGAVADAGGIRNASGKDRGDDAPPLKPAPKLRKGSLQKRSQLPTKPDDADHLQSFIRAARRMQEEGNPMSQTMIETLLHSAKRRISEGRPLSRRNLQFLRKALDRLTTANHLFPPDKRDRRPKRV